MFYYYFRPFNWISSILGLRKPFLLEIGWLSRIWSLIIILVFIISHLFAIKFSLVFDLKNNVDEISDTNVMIVNVMMILINVFSDKKLFLLYQSINNIESRLKIHEQSVKVYSVKLLVWISLQASLFAVLIILEIVFSTPPYALIMTIPIFLTLTHLILHLCIILSFLKIVNSHLLEQMQDLKKKHNNFIIEEQESEGLVKYMLRPTFYFNIQLTYDSTFDLKFLCRMYDEFCTCLQLLEQSHGVQILLTLWLMFSSAVSTVTLISRNKADYPWLEVLKGTLMLYWYALGCYIDDNIRKEVERTDLFIVKSLIDFQCDQSKKNILQTFRILIGTNRLCFTACNLYHLNFATLLGTMIMIMTDTIIMAARMGKAIVCYIKIDLSIPKL